MKAVHKAVNWVINKMGKNQKNGIQTYYHNSNLKILGIYLDQS